MWGQKEEEEIKKEISGVFIKTQESCRCYLCTTGLRDFVIPLFTLL